MKIIELLIDELDEALNGFTEVALVANPAIEADFYAFNNDNIEDAITYQIIKQAVKEKFVERLPGESRDDYMGRCIPKLRSEGMDQDQAVAVCIQTFDLDVDGLPPYSDEISGSIIQEEFESYDDYPQAASDNACKVLRWIDEHGRDEVQGMTRVGLARANQLCKREAISEETVGRMAAFIRHKRNAEISEEYKGTPWKDKGYVAYLGWGGDEGIAWAQRKLDQIERESLSKDKFFDNLDDDKQEKLLETLSNVGYSKDELLEDYAIVDTQEKFAGYPTKNSANPEGVTETKGNYKILYEYAGPRDSKNRTFCKRLLDLNLLFRKEDIQKLSIDGANSQEFGYYDIFSYKGSFGCRHSWRKKYVYKKKTAGLLEIAALLQDQKRRSEANVSDAKPLATFSKEFKFSFDDEQQRIVGPLMIPNKTIIRADENGEPYWVYFSEDTIRKIAYKMMKDKLIDKVNLEHNSNIKVDGQLEETWIVEDPEHDKQKLFGFDFPKGTWIGQYRINDPKVWDMIKEGVVKGFSIEAFLSERLANI